MLLFAGILCARFKNVFTEASAMEEPEDEGKRVCIIQIIQKKEITDIF